MVETSANRLAEFLLKEIGDGLRTVVITRPDDFHIVYLRDDLQEQYTKEMYSEAVDSFRLTPPFLDPDLGDLPLGERRAIVHYHDNALVIQLPFSATESILLSFTPHVGRNLLDFIEKCRQVVHDEASG